MPIWGSHMTDVLGRLTQGTLCTPCVHPLYTAAAQRFWLGFALVLALFIPAQVSAADLETSMDACLSAVETGSVDGFGDVEFAAGPNGTQSGDLVLLGSAVRVVFADIKKPAVKICTIFGQGETANDVIVPWGEVDQPALSWHTALTNMSGWEDITIGTGVGYGAMKCDRSADTVVVTSQPVWQMFKPLGSKPTQKEPKNAAFQFEARASKLIDCVANRARVKQSREG